MAVPSVENKFLAPNTFIGRLDQLHVAREAISGRACISFVGIPKAGLTSLLRRLMAEDFRAECQQSGAHLAFVYVDCSQYPDPLTLMRYILGQIVPDRPAPNLPNWRLVCGRFITTVKSLLPMRIVLLFDDFELMGSNEAFADFFDSLRGLAIEANMTLITATHTELHRCCHMRLSASPFPNIFKVQYLGPLSQSEALDFIRVAAADMMAALEPHTEQILNLGGRFPHYLGLACAYYQQVLAQGDAPDTQSMAARLCDESRPEFDRIWQGLDDNEKRALVSLAHGARVVDVDLSLVRKGYVSEGGVFSLAFRDYVGQAAP